MQQLIQDTDQETALPMENHAHSAADKTSPAAVPARAPKVRWEATDVATLRQTMKGVMRKTKPLQRHRNRDHHQETNDQKKKAYKQHRICCCEDCAPSHYSDINGDISKTV